MDKIKARYIFVILVVVLAIALLATQRKSGNQTSGNWPTTKVALATVERIEAPRAFHGVGELEAARQVELASETAGRITHIAFSSGQRVEKGQLLIQINDAPERAERLRLRAQFQNTETILARTRQLLADKVATQEQFDNAQAAYDMAQSALLHIEAIIAQKAVHVPFAGMIGIRRVHEGHYIQAGDAIANLVDADTLNVNFALEEQAVPHLQPGQPVQVKVDAWPEQTFLARIAAIDPLIGKSRTVQIQASLPNPDSMLQAGMFADIRVMQKTSTPVLAVPETAVTYTAYGETVFIAKADEQQALTVRRVAVKTGEHWQGHVEIITGLEEGDRVVVSGQIRLSDGMQVEAVTQDSLHDERSAPVTTKGQTS